MGSSLNVVRKDNKCDFVMLDNNFKLDKKYPVTLATGYYKDFKS